MKNEEQFMNVNSSSDVHMVAIVPNSVSSRHKLGQTSILKFIPMESLFDAIREHCLDDFLLQALISELRNRFIRSKPNQESFLKLSESCKISATANSPQQPELASSVTMARSILSLVADLCEDLSKPSVIQHTLSLLTECIVFLKNELQEPKTRMKILGLIGLALDVPAVHSQDCIIAVCNFIQALVAANADHYQIVLLRRYPQLIHILSSKVKIISKNMDLYRSVLSTLVSLCTRCAPNANLLGVSTHKIGQPSAVHEIDKNDKKEIVQTDAEEIPTNICYSIIKRYDDVGVLKWGLEVIGIGAFSNPSAREYLLSQDAVKTVVDIIKCNIEKASVVGSACDTLVGLIIECDDTGLEECEGVLTLLHALREHCNNMETVENVLRVLCLVVLTDSNAREVLKQEIGCILSALVVHQTASLSPSSQDSTAGLIANGLNLLAGLAANDTQMKDYIYRYYQEGASPICRTNLSNPSTPATPSQASGMSIIVECIKAHPWNEKVQQNGAFLLGALSENNTRNRDFLYRLGAHQVLSVAIAEFPENAQLQQQANWALRMIQSAVSQNQAGWLW
eukprot:GHVL01043509.1.p1 GENE.GHVL01043509.1~~GHVL01043509.1.p1  ORF type:complete len:651 (-),score=89.07 GHVL01043509.1:599-2302(-)